MTSEIEASDNKNLLDNSLALLYFQDSRVLDWMEKIVHRITNISTSWGMFAAASQFNWQRAETWLSTGRPISLISLDALIFCTSKGERADQAHWMKQYIPTLLDQPPTGVIKHRLREFLSKDSTPRTKSAVAQIIENLSKT